MNTSQQAKYRGMWTEGCNFIEHTAKCSFCDYRATHRRRGVPGGALAAKAKLRGRMMTHVRTAHPDKLEPTP